MACSLLCRLLPLCVVLLLVLSAAAAKLIIQSQTSTTNNNNEEEKKDDTHTSYNSKEGVIPSVCSGKVGGISYSLQKLADATGGNDVLCTDWLGNTYFFRPCQSLQQTQCKSATDPSPAVCQKDTRRPPRYHDCGSTTAVSWKPRNGGDKSGFFLEFTNGEEDRKLDIEFACDSSAGIGHLEAAENSEDPPHFYHLQWKSALVCPDTPSGDGGGGGTGDGDGLALSGGWIALIILASLMVIYLVGGVLFNRFRRGLQGTEMLPNKEFWWKLPGLVKDGHMYIYKKVRSIRSPSYQQVS